MPAERCVSGMRPAPCSSASDCGPVSTSETVLRNDRTIPSPTPDLGGGNGGMIPEGLA
jgi:hypothetical protein